MPTASILGGPDLHVDKGSMINLTCIIKYSPEPPSYIFWYHYNDVRVLHLESFILNSEMLFYTFLITLSSYPQAGNKLQLGARRS